MIKLVGNTARLKEAVESGNVPQFLSESRATVKHLRRADKAAQEGYLPEILDVLGELGIEGADTFSEILPHINLIRAIIRLINGGADVFVNQDKVTTQFTAVGGAETEGGEFIPVSSVLALSVDHAVEFKGWEILDNYQDFKPIVSFKVEGGVADNVTIVVTTTAIGLFQDDVDLDLEVQNLNGVQTSRPVADTTVVTTPGIQIVKKHVFTFTNLTSVQISPQAGARIGYGLDGANVGIIVGALAYGDVRGAHPFAMTIENAQYGISV